MRKFNRRTPVKTRKEPYLPFLFLKKAPVFPNFFFFKTTLCCQLSKGLPSQVVSQKIGQSVQRVAMVCVFSNSIPMAKLDHCHCCNSS